MKTAKQLIAEVEAELNAVKAADMGLEAVGAFAQEALNQQAAGDVFKTKEALENLVSLVVELRKAVPANVVPASAGPVGKSPKEHYIEQAAEAIEDSVESMRSALISAQELLAPIQKALESAGAAISYEKNLPKEPA